jgi:hypothetical protein
MDGTVNMAIINKYAAKINSVSNDFAAKDLKIPQFVGDGTNIYQVMEVGNNVFKDNINLVGSLTIPNSVVTISQDAFSGCNLTGTLSIGAGVTSIAQSAFDGYCFTDIIIDSKNTAYGLATNVGEAKIVVEKTDGVCEVDYSSTNREVISTLAIGELTIPNDVTTIGGSIFSDCRGLIGKLVIPDSVTTISGEAGYNGAF